MPLRRFKKLFSKRAVLLGSIVGAIAGIAYAQKNSRSAQPKPKSTKSSVAKFEAFFREYLKVGRAAFHKIGKNKTALDVLRGGEEILKELQKKARDKNTPAVRLAKRKTTEIVTGLGRQVRSSATAGKPKKRAASKKRATSPKKTARKITAKKPTRRRKVIKKK